MAIKRWLSNVAPVTIITTAVMLAVSLAALSIMLALSGPWLGVDFDRTYTGIGVRVLHVKNNSPAFDRLKSGDIIKAFVAPSHAKITVSSFTILDDPDQLASYAEYNSFFEHQQAVWEILSSSSFTAILGDDRNIELSSVKDVSPAILPAAFWWLLFFGGSSFLLGVIAWSMRRNEPVTRTLAASGVGFMVGAYSCGIYIARELAMPSKLFFGLAAANHIGIMVFAYSSILFFWYYPQRLGSGPAAWVCVVGVAALWINETLQWLSWPTHVFYAHFVVAYSLLIVFAYLQWRKSQSTPKEREMLKWLLSTMLLCLGFTIMLYYGPVIMTGKPVASTVPTFGSVFLFYLGLVIGIIRYRQFDMERWWIRAWQWLMLIFIALIADALFLYFMHMSETTSLGLAVGIGGIYLLARQWVWGMLSERNSKALDRVLPHLVNSIALRKQKITPEMQWQHLISSVFNPINVKITPVKCDAITIVQNGIAMQFPNLDGTATIDAFCCDKGNRVFTTTDIYLGNRLLELMRYSSDVITAREQGMEEERHRILRDLHDDVAARLLSLLHQTREPMISKVAQNALRGLRDVIYLLGAEQASLMDVVTGIEAGTREQLSGLGINFEWHSPNKCPDVMLSPLQHINLKRIAREAIANALKHAHPENIILKVELNINELCLRISNDGAITDPSNWIPNRGLNNIKSRAKEMRGSHKWGIEMVGENTRYCLLTVFVPLALDEKNKSHSPD